MKRLLYIYLLIPYVLSAQSDSIPLTDNWQFRQVATFDWLPAEVPGTVHTDLMKAGKIEDPFYRLNEKSLQWIDKVAWEYRTTFDLPANTLNRGKVILRFEGLDTYADVFLNGQPVLNADNMFRTWEVPVKDHLKSKNNELYIRFRSPILEGLKKQEQLGFPLPADNDQSENGGMGDNKVSIFTRKAPYSFGWDWGPRLVTSGIWRPVYLLAWDGARIEDLHIIQNKISADKATLTARFDADATEPGKYTYRVSTGDTPLAEGELSLFEGKQNRQVVFDIAEPRLWWPNGAGPQNLYNIKLELFRGSEPVASSYRNIGIRTLKHVRSPEPGGGETFYFEVNGRPVYAKGANAIPNDVFLPRVTPEKYEYIVKSAADANMNMIRIWGGGIYENDIFYDLCDRYGIMVWQDFMFACAMYPGDTAFLNNVRAEAVQNIKRLRNHPSIALWCGNNEIEYAWAQGDEKRGWGWKQRYNPEQRKYIWNSYENIFHKILPEVIKEYAPGQSYWASSPSQGNGVLSNNFGNRGDIHYWGVWHGLEPISEFKKYRGRFFSEYGFQSFPEFNNIKKFTEKEDWNIVSPVMESHQRSGIGNLRIRQYMVQSFRIPYDFEQFLYVSQLLQARAIRTAIETHRMQIPFNQGTLYWQLNDVWPVASWSGIDYYGKWKALHYTAKESFKNVSLIIRYENGGIDIWGVNDSLTPVKGSLRVNIMNFDGKSVWNRAIMAEIPANSAARVASFRNKELPLERNVDQIVVLAYMLVDNKLVDYKSEFLLEPKDLRLPTPKITYELWEEDGKFVLDLKTDKIAAYVMVVNDNADVNFSDNYFNMMANDVKRITCDATVPIEKFREGLRFLHLEETMRQ